MNKYDPLARFGSKDGESIDRLLDCYQACRIVGTTIPDNEESANLRVIFGRARAAGVEQYQLLAVVRDYLSAEAAIAVWPHGLDKTTPP